MLRAVTFDFWGTLYESAFAREERIQLLQETLALHGQPGDRADLEQAVGQAWQMLDHAWRRDHRSPGAAAYLEHVLRAMRATLPATAVAALRRSIEEVYLASNKPRMLAGVAEVLPVLASRYRIGLISDVGLTPGRLMRHVLDRDGLLQNFDALSFSDEVGVTKPEEQIFRHSLDELGVRPPEAAHVGDLPETDIAGAQAAGMRAVLFLGKSWREDDLSLADASFERYEELPALLASLD
jgi:HAD superfamily hydrolase (TIGR01549 family)